MSWHVETSLWTLGVTAIVKIALKVNSRFFFG